jgi:hypothetical protein
VVIDLVKPHYQLDVNTYTSFSSSYVSLKNTYQT